MPAHELFVSTASAWSARPTDPQDVFFAQVVEPGPPRADQPPGGVGLFGVPFDGAVLGRPGAREGPDAVRAQMAKLKPWTSARGDATRLVFDWGNVRVPASDVAAAHEATESAALAVLDAGQFPLAIGGDHSLTFPLVKAHEGRRHRIGLINLDAHLDVRDHQGVLNSGTSFGRLLALGLVPGANLVEMGIRDFANSPKYVEKVRKAGGTIIGADEWRADAASAITRAITTASRGVDGVYLSVDMDVLDQAHGPGVSAPTPDGIDSAQLVEAVRRIGRDAPLVGADFVEVAPRLDRDNLTSRAAAYAVMHLMAALPL